MFPFGYAAYDSSFLRWTDIEIAVATKDCWRDDGYRVCKGGDIQETGEAHCLYRCGMLR